MGILIFIILIIGIVILVCKKFKGNKKTIILVFIALIGRSAIGVTILLNTFKVSYNS